MDVQDGSAYVISTANGNNLHEDDDNPDEDHSPEEETDEAAKPKKGRKPRHQNTIGTDRLVVT